MENKEEYIRKSFYSFGKNGGEQLRNEGSIGFSSNIPKTDLNSLYTQFHPHKVEPEPIVTEEASKSPKVKRQSPSFETRNQSRMSPARVSQQTTEAKVQKLLKERNLQGLITQEILTKYGEDHKYSSQRINLQSMLRLKAQKELSQAKRNFLSPRHTSKQLAMSYIQLKNQSLMQAQTQVCSKDHFKDRAHPNTHQSLITEMLGTDDEKVRMSIFGNRMKELRKAKVLVNELSQEETEMHQQLQTMQQIGGDLHIKARKVMGVNILKKATTGYRNQNNKTRNQSFKTSSHRSLS